MRDATENKCGLECSEEAIAPNWGVTDNHAMVRFERRRWLHARVDCGSQGATVGSEVLGGGPKRTGKLVRMAWFG